jgi:uncharacterized protein (TIGR02099 family)
MSVMRNFLQRLTRIMAYVAGGLVILLAIAVGLFRLFLPRLPAYQEDIKRWASEAIGMQVEFSGMDARWGLSGPEVEFYNAELISKDTHSRIVAADEVSLGVGLVRLLVDRKFVVDRVKVRDSAIEVRQLPDGQWWVQGAPLDKLIPARAGAGSTDIGNIEVVGENIRVQFLQPGDERPRRFRVTRLLARRDDMRLAVDANVELPDDLGRRLTVSATQLLSDEAAERRWDVTVDIDDIKLAGVTALQPEEAARFDSGGGDITVSFSVKDKRVTGATADLDLDDIGIAGMSGVALSGRIEYLLNDDGWLVAADGLKASTPAGKWPASNLRFEAGTDENRHIDSVDIRASYLDLAFIALLRPWLGDAQRALVTDFVPSGTVHDLTLTMSGMDGDSPQFSVSADFHDLGIAASRGRPGVRGFSGSIRADRSGGLLEIDSHGLLVTAPKVLGKALELDTAAGTLVWRTSNDHTRVLSDSIVLNNDFFDSETSVEVSFEGAGKSPVVDLDGTFSIDDVAVARDYIPFMPERPNTSKWFREGLLSGRIPEGRIRLQGPLDELPFENDAKGRLLVEGKVRDAVVVYQPSWPAAQVIDADILVDNMRLYTGHNHIINAGNEIVDAKLEIADFRNPVLTLSAVAKGTLESFRQLSIQSPIAEIFGGQLDHVHVSGDATASLDLSVPIRNWRDFSFTTKLQMSGGTLQFEGFHPPLTDLSGMVTIRRDDVSSEALGGTFLGQPVSITVAQAPVNQPAFRVVASATGSATAAALVRDLGLPLGDHVTGATDYTAKLLFPRGDVEEPASFTIEFDSNLAGLAVDFPRPLHKEAGEKLATTGNIVFPRGGDRIESSGAAGDLLSWQMAFTKKTGWDIDRGQIVFGSRLLDDMQAETRGLHIRGHADYVYAQDWFDLSRERQSGTGVGDRIRSIDVTIGDLHLIGQHLVNHRVRVDRSANEWLVQLDGDQILGSAFVPYDLESGEPIVIEAERMLLPGDDEKRETKAIDPRSLPPITIKAQDLAFGKRHLGAVEAKFERTAEGLVAEHIDAKDNTFEIAGAGRWVVDEKDPAGSRSYLEATLTSTDVERTMRRLDYDPGITSNDLSMRLDLSWSGGPSEQLLGALDGSVKLRIGAGQLAEVRPGAGRVFGLMSVAALPRRLALDFSDVFGKGFGFDKISGSFRIVDGDTYTCDLSLEGPAADIGIVGRAGLVSRDYEQTAVVSASFGNALPVAGALVAGPQVAAALLIFSQIFKKPLQEVTQVYYSIGGSFDEPQIDTISAEQFAASGVVAGCIAATQ